MNAVGIVIGGIAIGVFPSPCGEKIVMNKPPPKGRGARWTTRFRPLAGKR